jgi:hypothetical protein
MSLLILRDAEISSLTVQIYQTILGSNDQTTLGPNDQTISGLKNNFPIENSSDNNTIKSENTKKNSDLVRSSVWINNIK